MKKSKQQQNPIEKKLRTKLDIKPFYTIKELQKIMGYTSANGARNFLQKLNIPMSLIGNKYIIYLSDLQTYTPQLFISIQEVNYLKSLQTEEEDPILRGQVQL